MPGRSDFGLRGAKLSSQKRGENMKLKVVIEKDETGFYVVEVPALPGCLSQGKTLAQAKTNIQEAIKGWVEVMNAKAGKRHAQTYQIAVYALGQRLQICSGAEAVKNSGEPDGPWIDKSA